MAVASYRLHFVGVWLRSVPLQALQPTTQVARVLLFSQPDPLLAPHSHAPGLQDLRWVALRALRSRGQNSAESNLVLSSGFVAYVDKGKAEFLLESSERPSTHPSPGCVCTAVTRRREGVSPVSQGRKDSFQTSIPGVAVVEREAPDGLAGGLAAPGTARAPRRPDTRAPQVVRGCRSGSTGRGRGPCSQRSPPPPAPVSLGPLPCLISN